MTTTEEEGGANNDQSNKTVAEQRREPEKEMAPNEVQKVEAATADHDKAPLDEDGEAKVNFVSNDAKLEMGEEKRAQDLYPALTKSELMKYATDPFWVKLRWALFVLFWVAWVAMLVVAVVIIVMAPKCYSPEPKQWWQKEPVYEIYVKSFKDSDASGTGDLKGVESKVDYLVSLGIGSVWLSPIYASPQKDNGYDISNFVDIDPSLGSMQDFKDLIKTLHDNGIKLIMDFVPNHSSDQHEWFQKSVKKEDPYTNYYVWKKGSKGTPPNNWKSVFGGSAWEWSDQRREYYLHQFYKEQPDLNVRDPKVVEELVKILQFWLDLGVDGFRMDAVAHLFEDTQLRNEGIVAGKADYDSVDHVYTYDLPEVLELLKTFREVLDKKTAEDTYNPRIMMTEAYLSNEKLVKYYGTNFTEHSGDIAQMPLNLDFLKKFMQERDATPENLELVINAYLSALPTNAWPNFNLGNHDNPRVASRLSHELVDVLNMIMLLLPGTPITYYGEEIGMRDNGQIRDADKRAQARAPMQWNANAHAGFTTGPTPWLPVAEDYTTINVAAQEAAEESHLKVYKALTHIRGQQSILFGATKIVTNDTLFAFNRVRKGNPGYLVAVNLGDTPIEANVTDLPNLPESGTVHVRSHHTKKEDPGAVEESPADPEALSRKIVFEKIPLLPKEGIVVTFVPKMS